MLYFCMKIAYGMIYFEKKKNGTARPRTQDNVT
jgi:hypothetical protein